MPLSDTQIRAIKPREKAFKVSDEKGLYLQVSPAGGKLWRFKYRFGVSERKLSFGAYPAIGLADARKLRDDAKAALARGDDPGQVKQRQKREALISANNTFGMVAEEFIATKIASEGKAESTLIKTRWFLDLLLPSIGNRPIAEIKPDELLMPLKKLEAKGRRETAHRCRAFASRVFRYGVATARCDIDPAATLIGALASPIVTPRAAITDPIAVGGLMRAIEAYEGYFAVIAALRIAPHLMVRPGELRFARWDEFDLDNAEWRIPAARMKARRPHGVPLSTQIVAILRELKALTGPEGLVFPSIRTHLRPLSENTFNAAFRRMGYGKDELTAHGLRSTASTLLNESGKWHPDAVERALAHGDSDAIRGKYNRGEYWEERTRMHQWWSDHLDALRDGAQVLPFAKSKHRD